MREEYAAGGSADNQRAVGSAPEDEDAAEDSADREIRTDVAFGSPQAMLVEIAKQTRRAPRGATKDEMRRAQLGALRKTTGPLAPRVEL